MAGLSRLHAVYQNVECMGPGRGRHPLARRQSNGRPTQQDHDDLRAQGSASAIAGKLQTEIEDMNLPNPVIRSHYGGGFIKRSVRD
jgi:hypothetical protein